MYKICLVISLVSLSFSSLGQDKELKRAFDEFQDGLIEQCLATLDGYQKTAKKVETNDAVLYYWVYTHALAAEGPTQNLSYAYELTSDFVNKALILKKEDEKAYFKMVEKFGCSVEKEGELMVVLDNRISSDMLENSKVSKVDEIDLDDQIGELLIFIHDFPNSSHLYEMSDRIDELRVRQAIYKRDESAIERFTKIESYNTPPIDLSRKAVIFNKNIGELNYVLQDILEERVMKTGSLVDLNKLKTSFPKSKVILQVEMGQIEKVFSNCQNMINFNQADIVFLEKENAADYSGDNKIGDINPEELIRVCVDESKIFCITELLADNVKYSERNYYFNANQELVAIDFIVKPLLYELPLNVTPIFEEKSKIYFFGGEVVLVEGKQLSKLDFNRAVELKKKIEISMNTELEQNPYNVTRMFNPYKWKGKPTHTILLNQAGYSVSIAIACEPEFDESSVGGETVVTIKKGAFEQKFQLNTSLYIEKNMFFNGIYRMPESEVESFQFLTVVDYNFDGFLDIGIDGAAGNMESLPEWYKWNPQSQSFVLDNGLVGKYLNGTLEFFPSEKKITATVYENGNSTSTFYLDNGCWREIDIYSEYTDFDSSDNMIDFTHHISIKDGHLEFESTSKISE
jgi:hypothetical protein